MKQQLTSDDGRELHKAINRPMGTMGTQTKMFMAIQTKAQFIVISSLWLAELLPFKTPNFLGPRDGHLWLNV